MKELHLYLYGEIGYDVTASSVQEQLTNAGEFDEIILHISSEGGGVFEGWTIGNIIKGTGKKVTAIIEGLCASIATYPAMLADTLKMAETAMFMIHNPKMGLEGEQKDMEGAADMLAKIKNDLIRAYKSKTGLDDNRLSVMMNSETFMTSSEAKANGFIDEIVKPIRAVAKFDIPKKEKMPDKKQNESIKKIESFIGKLKNLFTSVENAVNVELEDGTIIYVDSDDGELVGKRAFTTDAEGNPTEEAAPVGDHRLQDGRTITIGEDGTVTAISETTPAPEESVEALTAKLQASTEETNSLKEKLLALEAKEVDLTKANETLNETIQETKTTVTELVGEIENLKSITVGTPFKETKPITQPVNKTVTSPVVIENSLDAWGAEILKKLGVN